MKRKVQKYWVSILGWNILMIAAGGWANDSWVVFNREVKPVLEEHCMECHAGEKRKGGFSMNTRESILAGSETDEVVVPGKPEQSLLMQLVRETDPEMRMPPEDKSPLTTREIEILEKWVAEGLVWPDGFALGREDYRAPTGFREVEVPGSTESGNPIDHFLADYQKSGKVRMGAGVQRHRWIRKAWLDTIGLLPDRDQVESFVQSGSDQRAEVADFILSRKEAYAAHWMSYWNDWLRNDYKGTGFIDGGRKQITGWLFGSLYSNKPYDQFVRELLTEHPGAEGFLHGIKWRGTVNDSQRREMQAAQSISQIFLGTNLKCASCHDSFVNSWKLKEAYAFASVFAEKNLELHRCDKPIGKFIEPAFLFPELGTIASEGSRSERLSSLAEIVTSPENGRLARTIVNRIWAHYFGRGLVSDVDDMDQVPFSQDLLDWLAIDLAQNGYDLKRTMRWILTSEAYNVVASSDVDGLFKGPVSKRMSAEQFLDALVSVTGMELETNDELMKVDGRGQGGQIQAISKALAESDSNPESRKRIPGSGLGKWIWNTDEAQASAPANQGFEAVKEFEISGDIGAAWLVATADNELKVFLNEKKAGETSEWTQPIRRNVMRQLQPGRNVIRIEARNGGAAPNPAGAYVSLQVQDASGEHMLSVVSDADWKVNPGTTLFALGGSGMGPWNLTESLEFPEEITAPQRIRASYLFADELTRAMGRPSREQIVTRRDPYATTLELLELTNGQTIDQLLKKGAALWMTDFSNSPHQAVNQLFYRGLARPASALEMSAAFEIVGATPTLEGIQDLMWVMIMLPEFQIID